METRESKVVVITGASSGIGEATARWLSKRGDMVVLGARREERLRAIAGEIQAVGGSAIYQVTDVTYRTDVEALAKRALDEFDRIDVWINNAGIMPHSTFDKLKVDDWERMIDVNFKGVLYGIAAALPHMRERKTGQFFNFSSVAGHQTQAACGVYSGTKAAVLSVSAALRQEEAMAGSNIRVTVVSPGAIDTELPQSITDGELRPFIESFYETHAVSPDRIAASIAFAMDLPADTALNEIILRPTSQLP